MSRAKKKIAIIHDLQGRGDTIITEADCDLIANVSDVLRGAIAKVQPG